MSSLKREPDLYVPASMLMSLPSDVRDICPGNFEARVDVVESPDAYFIVLDLPSGVSGKDVKLKVEHDVLSIAFERKPEPKCDMCQYILVERVFGSFSRKLTLPEHINKNAITAEAKGGVLTITLPKGEHAKTKGFDVPVECKL